MLRLPQARPQHPPRAVEHVTQALHSQGMEAGVGGARSGPCATEYEQRSGIAARRVSVHSSACAEYCTAYSERSRLAGLIQHVCVPGASTLDCETAATQVADKWPPRGCTSTRSKRGRGCQPAEGETRRAIWE